MTLITGPLEVAHAGSLKGNRYHLDEYFVRRPGDDVAVASEIIDPVTSEPSKENAQLFAAAPDLLAALTGMVEQANIDGWHNEEDCKVEGRHIPGAKNKCHLCEASTVARAAIAKATQVVHE